MEAASFGAMYGLAAVMMAFYYVVVLGVAVLQYVALWKVFVKAGEPGWKCLIPFYNGHTMYKMFWKPVYYWLSVIFAFVVCTLLIVWMGVCIALDDIPVAFTVATWGIYVAFFIVLLAWSIKVNINMSRAFGHGGAFAAGLIFLPAVFLLILAFGKDVYLGNPSVKQPQVQSAPQQEPWEQNGPAGE